MPSGYHTDFVKILQSMNHFFCYTSKNYNHNNDNVVNANSDSDSHIDNNNHNINNYNNHSIFARNASFERLCNRRTRILRGGMCAESYLLL